MDITVIATYRCNSKCSMCYAWQNPSLPREEVSLETLAKLPAGVDNLNITGGEPTLREDLAQIVALLHPKARKLEISSNGLHPQALEDIVCRYPDVKIRFSLEGLGATNDTLRGERGGFEVKTAGLNRLKELGGCDLGFASVIQDGNAAELPGLYRLAQEMGVELATSALHNAFQFHKANNYPYDRLAVARYIEGLVTSMLKTRHVKNWFRAYLNLGLIEKVLGHPRLIPCTAGSDFAFLDPWGDVYACNVRPDLKMGSLEQSTWEEVFHSYQAQAARRQVVRCVHNCWMVGSARTAMRHPTFTRLPKLKPLLWVLVNKLRVTLGLRVPFECYVDYENVAVMVAAQPRPSFLESRAFRRRVQCKDENHYQSLGEFFNQ